MRIGIIGSLRDRDAGRLRRVEILVTAQASPPARAFGSPVAGVPPSGATETRIGPLAVIAGVDGPSLARLVKRADRKPVVLVVGPRGTAGDEALLVEVEARRARGLTVEVVEVSPSTCLELAVENRAIVGIPAPGVARSFLPAAPGHAVTGAPPARERGDLSPFSPAVFHPDTPNPAPGFTVTRRVAPPAGPVEPEPEPEPVPVPVEPVEPVEPVAEPAPKKRRTAGKKPVGEA